LADKSDFQTCFQQSGVPDSHQVLSYLTSVFQELRDMIFWFSSCSHKISDAAMPHQPIEKRNTREQPALGFRALLLHFAKEGECMCIAYQYLLQDDCSDLLNSAFHR
jgi:hypothetical protein